jgi:eukaryotic-like serine/threonine-protein kinase
MEVEAMNGPDETLGVTLGCSPLLDSAGATPISGDGGPGAAGPVVTELALELLERWDEQYRQGVDLAPESLCAGHPELVDDLRERIRSQKRLYGMFGVTPEKPTASQGTTEPLPLFPGHETLDEIGHGGMGVVYKARDLRLGRLVAIKTIAQARHATREQVERFLNEARAVAKLDHEHIIPIHGIGEHEGRPYITLEYAAGGNLAQLLAVQPMHAKTAAALVETIARAAHAAHEKGIVHRDIKPTNVLLTAEGTPKLADFGLAKLLDADSTLTGTGQPLGTPSYMAPEQAKGQSRKVGPTADVYGLGAILYQALVGRPPFVGGSPIETLNQVLQTDVVPPRRLRPEIPRDLETICLKCLDKEPQRRYSTAAELADELRRFQEGRPIAARPIGLAGKSWRWARREPWRAGLSASLLLTFLLGTPILLALWLGARADRATARSEAAISKAVNDFLNRDLLANASPSNLSSLGIRPDPDVKLRDVLDRAAKTIGSRFANQPLVEAAIQKTIGETYLELGLYPNSLEHLRRALELQEREHGPDHPDSLIARSMLGGLMIEDGKLDEAEKYLVPALDGLTRLVGPDNSETLLATWRIAKIDFPAGRLASAVERLNRVRSGYERVLGPDAPETLEVINDLACVTNEQGNVAARAGDQIEAKQRHLQAEKLLLGIIEGFGDRLNPDHPATLGAKGNLADNLVAQGRRAEAVRIRQGVLETQRKVLGNQHPGTLYTMVALANLYREDKKYKEAEPLLEEAIRGCRVALDRNHETAVGALGFLSEVYIMLGKLEKVGPVLTEARDITVHRWGADSGMAYQANQVLGLYLLFGSKAYARAETYLRKVIEYLNRNQPDEASRFAAEGKLGFALLAQKKHAEARSLLLSAYSGMKAREKSIPPGLTGEIANIIRWTAQLYHETGRRTGDRDFDPIRSEPSFQTIILDLGFPADPFTPPDNNASGH